MARFLVEATECVLSYQRKHYWVDVEDPQGDPVKEIRLGKQYDEKGLNAHVTSIRITDAVIVEKLKDEPCSCSGTCIRRTNESGDCPPRH